MNNKVKIKKPAEQRAKRPGLIAQSKSYSGHDITIEIMDGFVSLF